MNDWAPRGAVNRLLVALLAASASGIAGTGGASPRLDALFPPGSAWLESAPAPAETARAGAAAPGIRFIEPRPEPVHGTGVEGLPIGRIDIVPLNIFDPVPPGRLAFVLRLANRFHVRTRKRTIAEQLLFARGDPWSESRARETERILRALDFLTPARIEARPEGDSAIVSVVTRDFWTTSAEFNLEQVDRKQYGSIIISESNLLGLGKAIAFSYREDPSGTSRSVSYDDPSILSSRLRFHYSAGTGSAGAINRISGILPFYAEDTPFSYGLAWRRVTSEVRLFQGGIEAASLDQRLEETDAFWGHGRRANGTIRRVTYSLLSADRRLGPTRLEPGAPPEFAGGESSLRLRRVAAEGRVWRPHFVERLNVNRMTLIEDFDLGESAAVKVGVAPHFLGSTADDGYAQLKLDAGTETPLGFGWVRASASSRIRREPREIVAQLDGRWIYQSRDRQTLVLAAHGVLGSRTERDFQVVVGGLNGLRAYPVEALAGQKLWRFNLEDRWIIWKNYRDFLAMGVVAFTDGARAWGPGAAGTGWFYSAGAGLRFSLPQWSPGRVLRVDVAWPISPTRDGVRDAVLSFGSSQAF